MVTFHGSMEWALDYVMQSDVVWIPLEEQLREQLVARVDWLGLEFAGESYVCRIKIASEQHSFGASNGSDAYGEALLFLLLQASRQNDGS